MVFLSTICGRQIERTTNDNELNRRDSQSRYTCCYSTFVFSFSNLALDFEEIVVSKWLSLKLVKLAILFWPENPEAAKFYLDMLIDLTITGKTITRVEPEQYLK